MEPYQIILLIFIVIAFFYVSVIVYVMTQMREFRLRLKKRRRGLSLLLYERNNALSQIIEYFDEEGIAFNEEDKRCFASFWELSFEKYEEAELREEAEVVKMVTSRVKYIAQANRSVLKSEAYQSQMDLLEDLERNYRMVLGKYNMDVIAYNYWIAIPLVGWFGYLFGYRKKAPLN